MCWALRVHCVYSAFLSSLINRITWPYSMSWIVGAAVAVIHPLHPSFLLLLRLFLSLSLKPLLYLLLVIQCSCFAFDSMILYFLRKKEGKKTSRRTLTPRYNKVVGWARSFGLWPYTSLLAYGPKIVGKHEDVSKVHAAIIPSNLHGIWHANPYLTSFDIQHPDLLRLECFQLF